jgi:hypothetical protein
MAQQVVMGPAAVFDFDNDGLVGLASGEQQTDLQFACALHPRLDQREFTSAFGTKRT